MILFFTQYKRWFEIIAIGLAIVALVVGFQMFCEGQREKGRVEVRAEYAEQMRIAKEGADKLERELRSRVDDAVVKGNEREQTIRNLATANSNASIGLRNATASIGNSLPSLSIDALRNVASAYGNILTECQSRYGEMAATSERLNSEKQTLIDSWPKNTNPAK